MDLREHTLMMTITRINGDYRLIGVVRGIAVYLDNFAIIRIAKESQQRRDRFLNCLSDGSADFAKKLGLVLDLTGAGMGPRMERFSMLVENGVAKTINVEPPKSFGVSSAETMLTQV